MRRSTGPGSEGFEQGWRVRVRLEKGRELDRGRRNDFAMCLCSWIVVDVVVVGLRTMKRPVELGLM